MGRLGLDLDAWLDGGRLVIELAGEVDCYSVPLLRDALQHDGTVRPLRIAVLCARLEFIDSAGLGALVGAVKRAQLTAGGVALVGCTARVERMVRMMGLDKVLGLHPGIDDAFAWLDAR